MGIRKKLRKIVHKVSAPLQAISGLTKIASIFAPELAPFATALSTTSTVVSAANKLSSGRPNSLTLAPSVMAPLTPLPNLIGGSTLADYDDFTGWEEAVQAAGGITENGATGVVSPPGATSSSVWDMVGSAAGSVLNAVIPSAQAANPATVASAAGAVATAVGAAFGAGAAGIAMIGRMSQTAAVAIFKISQRLRGTSTLSTGQLASYGRSVYNSIAGFVRRNPTTSAIALLTGLGLTAEEAAHFLAWGATSKRRKRGRGLSYRDLRTTRRTMRKVISMSQSLRHLCAAVPHRSYRRK